MSEQSKDSTLTAENRQDVPPVRRVLKYELPVDDHSHEIPFWVVGAAQKGDRPDVLFLWAEVEIAEGEEPTTEPYRVFATGQPIPLGAAHHATVQVPPFVLHVYNTALCDETDR